MRSSVVYYQDRILLMSLLELTSMSALGVLVVLGFCSLFVLYYIFILYSRVEVCTLLMQHPLHLAVVEVVRLVYSLSAVFTVGHITDN